MPLLLLVLLSVISQARSATGFNPEWHWVVILASAPDKEAAATLATQKANGAFVIHSDEYYGLNRGHWLVVSGKWPTRKASLPALQEARRKFSDAYVKYVGGQRDLNEARETAVYEWALRHQKELQQKDSAASYSVESGFDLGEKGFRVWERTRFRGVCKEAYRDLSFNQAKALVEAPPWAENCCAKSNCPSRTPMGWMLEFMTRPSLSRCDSKLAFTVQYQGEPAKRIPCSSLKTADEARHFWEIAFNPLRGTLDCPQDFDPNGEAICRVSAPGEGYNYLLKRRDSRVFLVGFEIEFEE